MPEALRTQLYLTLEIDQADRVEALLDAAKPACVRLVVTEARQQDIAMTCRALCHASGIPLLIAGPDDIAVAMARAIGADGVHLTNAPKAAPWVRGELGETVIVGIDPGPSRHDAMIAAESGADYVSLAPEWEEGAVPDEISWWSAMIETPMVVENAQTRDRVKALQGLADFVVAEAEQAETIAAALGS